MTFIDLEVISMSELDTHETQHWTCWLGGKIAFCGEDVSGQHICPEDDACGCVICENCVEIESRTTLCPNGGQCTCFEDE